MHSSSKSLPCWRVFVISAISLIFLAGDKCVAESLDWVWLNPLPGSPLTNFTFPEPFKGFATGRDAGGNLLFRTTDGGLTWSWSLTATADMSRLDFPDVMHGVALSLNDSTILRTVDGGFTWQQSPSGTSATLEGVSMADSMVGIAVGRNGTILRTIDGGGTWVEQTSGTTEPLWDVWCIDTMTAVAVGDYTILRTANGGNTWTQIPAGFGNEYLYRVAFADAHNGFAVGDFATILHTTDGGLTWEIQLKDAGNDAQYFWLVSAVDSLNAIATGFNNPFGAVVRTTDGGVTWVAEPFEDGEGGDPYFGFDFALVGMREGLYRAELSPTMAVAISYFRAHASDEVVTLSSTFNSSLRVLGVNVYRAVGSASFTLYETVPFSGVEFKYEDRCVEPGHTYRYQIGVVDGDGEFLSQVATVTVPRYVTVLFQNAPNPFNSTTTISFTLEEPAHVTLSVYDIRGRHVRTLVHNSRRAGPDEVMWNGTDASGSPVSSGVYVYRMTAGKTRLSRCMVLLK